MSVDKETLATENEDDPLTAARNYRDHPPEPPKLHVESQLQNHLDRFTPDEVSVEVNGQFRTTYAKVRDDGETLAVDWDLFDSEQHYEDAGWSVICYVSKLALEDEDLPTGRL